VSGGSGFCAQNQRRLHFGLGKGAAIQKVVVRWPSGKIEERTDLAANQVHALKEPA
jgi:enediyne biosynthesis protein E4